MATPTRFRPPLSDYASRRGGSEWPDPSPLDSPKRLRMQLWRRERLPEVSPAAQQRSPYGMGGPPYRPDLPGQIDLPEET